MNSSEVHKHKISDTNIARIRTITAKNCTVLEQSVYLQNTIKIFHNCETFKEKNV